MRRAILLGTIAILAVGWMRGISAKTRPEYPCAFKTETGQLVSLRDATRLRERSVRLGHPVPVVLNEVTRTNARSAIACTAKAYGMDVSDFLSVADCETGGTFDPKAVSPGGHQGLYQHDPQYWPARAASYGHKGASALDGYSAINVTIQFVQDFGWEAWQCQP